MTEVLAGVVIGTIIGYAFRTWSDARIWWKLHARRDGFKSVRQYKRYLKERG